MRTPKLLMSSDFELCLHRRAEVVWDLIVRGQDVDN